MKIIHIIGNMGSGGAEKLLLETLHLYKKNGVICDLLVFDGKDYSFMKALKGLECCTVFSLGNGSIYNPLLIIKLIPFLRKYNIAHVHLFPAQYWVVLSKLLSFSKIKLILTEHSSTNSRMKLILLRGIDKFIYKSYSKIVCITDEIQEKFIQYTNLGREKFITIHNGVNLETITNALPYSKNEISDIIHPEDKLLIQVSRFCSPKDQGTVIKSLLYLPKEVKLILVGEGDLKEQNQNLALDLGLNERVLFLGLRMDVPRLLKSSDIVILSTFYEGLSLSSIEGMASGKPFLCSNVEGLSNIVSDAGVLFEKEDVKGLAEIIKNLLTNPDLYNTIVNNCINKAKKYDINKMVAKHIDLYKSIFKKNENFS